MHRQSSIPFNQSGIGVRAITMTAKTAPANAAAPITAAVFLLKFFFTALQISMAQTTQTAAAKARRELPDDLRAGVVDVAGVKAAQLVEAVKLEDVARVDRKMTRLNSSHIEESRMPSSA